MKRKGQPPIRSIPSRKSSFITIGANSVSTHSNIYSANRSASQSKLSCYEWKQGKVDLESCIYSIVLEQTQPIVIFVEADDSNRTFEILKTLVSPDSPVIHVPIKSVRNQIKKSLKNISPERGIIILEPTLSVFTSSCMPPRIIIRTIIYTGDLSKADFDRRQKLPTNASTKHIYIGNNVSDIHFSLGAYVPTTAWLPHVSARASAARKLFHAISEGKKTYNVQTIIEEDGFDPMLLSDEDNGRKKSLAAKVEALKNRLKVLMCTPLPHKADRTRLSSAAKLIENPKVVREKMIRLGMIYSETGPARHAKAEQGRSLAATQWMDGTSGTELGCPWTTIRYGASSDTVSQQVCHIISTYRTYVAKKTMKYRQLHNQKVKKEDEIILAPKKLLSGKLRSCLQVSGFCWQPNPKADDEWGGEYGKSCGHNEVAMFFSRPFAPMEVLNTHLCSRSSPAPGNLGFDGCLEFLIAQCKWFGRPMTVWDHEAFHYITQEGIHHAVPKKELLGLPVHRLDSLVVNLRELTVYCDGSQHPSVLIDTIQFLLSLVAGTSRIAGLGGCQKLQRLVCRFLLTGSLNAIVRAANS